MTDAVLPLRLVFVDHRACVLQTYLVFSDVVKIVVANRADLNMQMW